MAGPSEELSCKELVELITNYLEGALSAPDRQRFEEHLSVCPGCREYLAQMRQTIRAVGRLSEESLPPKAREQLLDVFRNWKRQ
jgi:anti-sigma factor RsiW